MSYIRILLIIGFVFFLTLLNCASAQAEYCDCSGEEALPRLYLNHPYLSDEAVAYLQARLLENNYDPGPVDGIYGPRTQQAVLAFARTHGIDASSGTSQAFWQNLLSVEPATAISTPNAENTYVTIDLFTHKLLVYSNGKPYREYPVACGTSRTPSPIGEWKVVHKSLNWGTGFGTRWLGLNVPWGIYGIHGTNKPWSIGTSASHGCIRMFNRDVEELYSLLPAGTPVKIFDSSLNGNPAKISKRTIKPGYTGQDIVYIQERLKAKGFYLGYADGRYGKMTMLAVKYLQSIYAHPATGIIDEETYYLLGFAD